MKGRMERKDKKGGEKEENIQCPVYRVPDQGSCHGSLTRRRSVSTGNLTTRFFHAVRLSLLCDIATVLRVKGKQTFCRRKYFVFLYWIYPFLWHVQNAIIPCRFQQLLPFFSVIYFLMPLFSTNYYYILPPFMLLSISWSTFWSC